MKWSKQTHLLLPGEEDIFSAVTEPNVGPLAHAQYKVPHHQGVVKKRVVHVPDKESGAASL